MIQKNIQFFTAIILLTLNLNTFSMQQLGKAPISAPSKLGEIFLMHTDNKYFVIQNGAAHAVQKAWVDKSLRNLNTLQLARYLTKGNFISISQATDGGFSLEGHTRGKGGGTGGAAVGFWGAKIAVWGAAHGTIALIAAGVGIVNGPAGLVVGQALESTFSVPIEMLSNTVAIAASIALGTATGPI